MYKWNVTFVLKSGEMIKGYYEGPENTSGDVANKILCNKKPNTYFGLYGPNERHNLLVNCDEIAALDIWAC